MDRNLLPKYAVIYQSKSGNTKILAEQIFNALDTEEKELIDIDVEPTVPKAEVYFVGFGVHSGFCSREVLEVFEQITNGKFALFATCGYMPTEQYKVRLEKHLDVWLPEESEYLGMYLCQGNIESDRQKIMLSQMPNKERELKQMFSLGSTHPDQEDIELAVDFAVRIQVEAEKE